jgi:transposase
LIYANLNHGFALDTFLWEVWPFFGFAGGTYGVKKGYMHSHKKGHRYDKEFKEDAVALVRSGKEIVQVARDLGVPVWSLRYWVKQGQAGTLTEAKTLANETPEQRELRRLRQENDYLIRQRDILKKALAIVSEQNPSSDSR